MRSCTTNPLDFTQKPGKNQLSPISGKRFNTNIPAFSLLYLVSESGNFLHHHPLSSKKAKKKEKGKQLQPPLYHPQLCPKVPEYVTSPKRYITTKLVLWFSLAGVYISEQEGKRERAEKSGREKQFFFVFFPVTSFQAFPQKPPSDLDASFFSPFNLLSKPTIGKPILINLPKTSFLFRVL